MDKRFSRGRGRTRLRQGVVACVVAVGFVVVSVDPVLAQSGGGDGGALGDIIINALIGLLEALFDPIRDIIERHGDALLKTVVGTPRPDAVFSRPTNGAWPAIYDYYWRTIVPLSLTLWGLAIGLVIFFESTSHLFSGYHRSKLKRRAFSGLLGILAWWWIAALSLRFMDALAGFLVPSVAEISLFQTLSFTGMGVLGLVFALSADLVLFVLIGLIYLARQLALYLFVLLMPLLIVLWIPGVGPFALVSKFMKKLASFYVPFLFMTIPVALLFRLGDLLGSSASLSAGGIGLWLTALVIPLAAVVSPFILFWQAGLLFVMANQASQHVSAQRTKDRLSAGREGVQSARQGGRNVVRGVRDEPAVRRDGQTLLDSGKSRAHATGSRLNTAGSQLRDTLRDDSRGGRDGSGSGDRGGGQSDTLLSDGGEDRSGSDDECEDPDRGAETETRSTGQGALRGPPTRSQPRNSTDNEPRDNTTSNQ